MGGFSDFFSSLFGGVEVAATKVAKAETAIVDSIHPRSLCLGNGAWETSLIWRQSHNFSTNALEPKEALTDVLAIADHPMGPISHIWLDDDRYTIGTTTGVDGDDFIPADTDDNWQDEIVDAGWYVCNVAKEDMRDIWQQTGGDGFRRPAIMFRYYNGTQTDLTGAGGDEWLNLVPGWTDQNRAGNRVALFPVTWRFGVNDRVTPGSRPGVLLEGQGSTEVYDWRNDSTGFTSNAALCLANVLMWEYFPYQRVDDSWDNVRILTTSFDSDAMEAAADLCDETSTGSPLHFTGPRYTVSYQMFADSDPEELIEDFSMAMGGARIFMRNEKIVIVPGGPRSWSVGFDLEDLSAHRSVLTPTKRPRRSRFNAIRPEYRNRGGGWEFTDAELVAPSAYLNDDEGRRRTKKLRFNAIGGANTKERAQRLAKIWLDRHRLEDRATLAVHALNGVGTTGNLGGALRAEEADIVRLTYARKGWTNKLFEISSREWDRETHTFTFELDEWSDDIDWDGEGIVADEATERGDFRRGGLAKVTGLAWAPRPRSTILASGELLIDGVLSWTNHPDTLVDDIGGYRIRFKETGETDWVSSQSKTNFKRLDNLRREVEHKAEVKASLPGIDSEWSSTLTFTPTGEDRPLGSPPGSIRDSDNLVDNPRFEQGTVGWNFTDASAGSNTVGWIATGGRAGPAVARAIVTTSECRVRPNEAALTAVEVGQRHVFRAWHKVTAVGGSGASFMIIQVLYYDADKVFISGSTVNLAVRTINSTDADYERQRGQHTVPSAIGARFMRVQLVALFDDSRNFTVLMDDFNVRRILGGVSTFLAPSATSNTAGTGVGDVWTNVRSITAGTPGDPVYISANFEARIGDPDDVGTGLTLANQLSARIVRYEEDGTSNETVITAETNLGDEFGPIDPPDEHWGPWGTRRIDGVDETGARGTFVYRAQVRCSVNGKLAVRERQIQWSIGATAVST